MRHWLRVQRLRAVARIRRRRYRVLAGSGNVRIAPLISPLRYDIVVRRDFLSGLKERLGAPLPELAAWAKTTPYWNWFRDVRWVRSSRRLHALHVGIDAAFEARVAAAAALCRSFARRGFDERFPINLKSADRVLGTQTGKRAEAQLFAGGGCHRIALLWIAGARELQPSQYIVHHYRELVPHDNTWPLRALFAGRGSEYVRFVSSAYMGSEMEDADALLSWVVANAPERLAGLRELLEVDGIAQPLALHSPAIGAGERDGSTRERVAPVS